MNITCWVHPTLRDIDNYIRKVLFVYTRSKLLILKRPWNVGLYMFHNRIISHLQTLASVIFFGTFFEKMHYRFQTSPCLKAYNSLSLSNLFEFLTWNKTNYKLQRSTISFQVLVQNLNFIFVYIYIWFISTYIYILYNIYIYISTVSLRCPFLF